MTQETTPRVIPAWSDRAFNIGLLVGAMASPLILGASASWVLRFGKSARLACEAVPL